jgi:AraC-like DNA-binding protein
MSGSAISTFQDPDDFWAALKEVGYRHLLVVEPGAFRAQMTSILLSHVRLSHVEERLARTAFVTLASATTRVLLPVTHGSVSCGGVALSEGHILTHGAGSGIHERVAGPVAWRDILIASRHLSGVGRGLPRARLNVPAAVRLWLPPAARLHKLSALHARATRLTESRPRKSRSAQVPHDLEQELIGLLIECLSFASIDTDASDISQNIEIVARFEKTMRAHGGQILKVPTICRQLGVDERNLRRFCQSQLGLSPARYLRLRRMQLVHRVLQDPESLTATVEQVARGHGFSQLGRFAASYRVLYGELPSATLRRTQGKTMLR